MAALPVSGSAVAGVTEAMSAKRTGSPDEVYPATMLSIRVVSVVLISVFTL